MQKYLALVQKFVSIYQCKMKIKKSFVERSGTRVDVKCSLIL